MKNFVNISIILLIIFFSNIESKSQISAFYNFAIAFDTNPFTVNNQKESIYQINHVNLNYKSEKSNFSISYNGNLTNILSSPEYNYNIHRINSNFLYKPFNYEYFEINFGALAKLKNNSINNRLFNFGEINFDFENILYSDYGIISLKYTPELSIFSNYSELSNFTNNIKLSIDKTFDFETNLILELGLKSKYFYNNENGNLKYKRFENQNPSEILSNFIANSNNNRIISFKIDINQPISEDIIFELAAYSNIHLNKNGFYFATGITDLYSLDDFFNNNSNFEEKSILFGINCRLFENFKLNIVNNYHIREFLYSNYLINENYSKNINRKDFLNDFSILLNYVIFEYYGIFDKLTSILEFKYFNNDSNLEEYTFKNSGIIFTIRMQF